MKFDIGIQETPEHSWVDREIFGMKWFWTVRPGGRWIGSESGFARSKASAHRKTAKVAKQIAAKVGNIRPPLHTYEIEVEK